MKKFLIYSILVIFPFLLAAQDSGMHKIDGSVYDENGEPLMGATIRVAHQANGTITDIDGRFSIFVPSGKKSEIIVSYVGYATQTLEVSAETTNVKVDMKVNAGEFDEVVVIGYGTAKKTGLTASVETLSGDDLLKIPAINIDQSLAGQAAGLGVHAYSGDPSSARESRISIRGNTGDPLLVIDGVPRLGVNTNDGEMRLSDLNPDDIESISILKDAAAAAVYGARAANGVILVQTKRGNNSGKTKVSYRGQFNFEEATYLPKFLDSYKFAELYNRAVESSASDTREPYDLSLIGSDPNLYGDSDLFDYFKKWGHSQSHSVSLSGGVNSIRYFISGGYSDSKGLYSGVGRNRYNYSVKVDADIFTGLSMSVDLTGAISEYKNTSSTTVDDAYSFSPLEVLRYTNGQLASLNSANPLINVEGLGGYRKTSSDYHTVNAVFRYDIPCIDGLQLYLKGTMDFNHTDLTEFRKPVALYLYDAADGSTSVDQNTVYPKAKITMLNRKQRVNNMLVEAGINYNHTFAEKHSVTALAVVNYQDYKNKYLRAINDNLPGELPEVVGNTSNGSISGSETYSQRASVVGRASYGYDNRYFAEFSFRVDGSTRFAPGNRWGFFPTVSGSWVISNEPFFANVAPSLLSFAKVRASTGILGNDGVASDFSYMQYYNFTSTQGYNFGNLWTVGLLPSISSFPNPDLKWGKSKDVNFGVDLGFWNNRLSASLELYQRMNTNMVTSAQSYLFPPSVGTGGVTPSVNVGKVRYRGWDLSFKHLNNLGDFRYDVSFNIGSFSDKVLNWGDESSISENLRRKGQPMSVWLLYEADGLFQSQEEIDAWDVDQDGRGNVTLAPGDIKYKDQDGDNKLTTADMIQVRDSSLPDIVYGIGIGASWKGFHIHAQFQGVGGYTQMINELYTLESGSLQRFQDYHYTDSWTPDNPNAKYPRIKFAASGDNNRKESTYWIQKCNYLRLKALTIGYRLPASLLKKARISTVDITLQGTNLLTWSSLDNMDPESLRGYPLQRSYGISFNFGF